PSYFARKFKIESTFFLPEAPFDSIFAKISHRPSDFSTFFEKFRGNKARTYLENLASPIKAGVKFGLEKIAGYENLSEMVLKGGSKAESVGKFLGKSVKIIGKGATVLTIADISITGLSKGIDEYSKTKDIGKAVKKVPYLRSRVSVP
ncbi:hypothetical protein LZU32_07240, partial [Streptococcus agalactiae]|nr:hypothetical protein [Streptococcus agalactiae]